MTRQFDVAVIGAGAAGMMCASVAGQRGRRVVLIDHAEKLAEKIRISGGGRCNFTNTDAGPANYLSQNPHFCRSALSRYTPQDFIGLVKQYRIPFHEKHKGQLFCDRSAEDIIAMLKAECDAGGVQWMMPAGVKGVAREGERFRIATGGGEVVADRLVVATGGAVDSENRCDRLRVSPRETIRYPADRGAARAGAADLRSAGLAAVRADGGYIA